MSADLLHIAVEANRNAAAALLSASRQRNSRAFDLWFGNGPRHVERLSSLASAQYEFAAPLIDAVRKFLRDAFDADLAWASIALDEDAHDFRKTNQSLGLRRTLLMHSGTADDGFRFETSFTGAFLEKAAQDHSGSHAVLGLLVTKDAVDDREGVAADSRGLLTVHTANDVFVGGPVFNTRFDECLRDMNTTVPSDRWMRYINAFDALAGPVELRAHMSITSLYFLDGQHAASQLIVGFSKLPPDLASVRTFYGLAQATMAGFALVYAGIRHEQRQGSQHRDRVRLLEQPLARLNSNLASVQREVQALRGVLYDPARQLFEQHATLAPLFDSGELLRIGSNTMVELHHHPGDYDLTSASQQTGRAIVAAALCTILGLTIPSAPSVADIVRLVEGLVVVELTSRLRFPNGDRFVEDLLWLCGCPTDAPPVSRERANAADAIASGVGWVLHTAEPGRVLERIKEALVDPFKAHAPTWNTRAFDLAARASATHRDKLRVIVPPDDLDFSELGTPASAHHVLELLMAVVSAAKPGAELLEARVTQDERGIQIVWRFDGKLLESRDGAVALREQLRRHVLTANRDWRIMHEVAGDFRKPFVEFANRLLGLGADASDWQPLKTYPEPLGAVALIALQRHATPRNVQFQVNVTDDVLHGEIHMIWQPVSIPATSNARGSPLPALSDAVEGPPVLLLDHEISVDASSSWQHALTDVGMTPLWARHPKQERSVVAVMPNDASVTLFLHATRSLRSVWNDAVLDGRFKGHLVHIGVGGAKHLSAFDGLHERIHYCVVKPAEFADGIGEAFSIGWRVGKPPWKTLQTARVRQSLISVRGPAIVFGESAVFDGGHRIAWDAKIITEVRGEADGIRPSGAPRAIVLTSETAGALTLALARACRLLQSADAVHAYPSWMVVATPEMVRDVQVDTTDFCDGWSSRVPLSYLLSRRLITLLPTAASDAAMQDALARVVHIQTLAKALRSYPFVEAANALRHQIASLDSGEAAALEAFRPYLEGLYRAVKELRPTALESFMVGDGHEPHDNARLFVEHLTTLVAGTVTHLGVHSAISLLEPAVL